MSDGENYMEELHDQDGKDKRQLVRLWDPLDLSHPNLKTYLA